MDVLMESLMKSSHLLKDHAEIHSPLEDKTGMMIMIEIKRRQEIAASLAESLVGWIEADLGAGRMKGTEVVDGTEGSSPRGDQYIRGRPPHPLPKQALPWMNKEP
jgi:hypothetical protein